MTSNQIVAASAKKRAERGTQFEVLYRREHSAVLRFLLRRTPPERAEDLAHEVFLVAWRRFDELPSTERQVRAWLFAVARNCLLNDQRGIARRDSLSVKIAAEASTFIPGPDAAVVARVDLGTAWGSLDTKHQETLALTAWEGLTAAEAGRVLGISATAFRLRLHRARAALKAALATDARPLPGLLPNPSTARSPEVS